MVDFALVDVKSITSHVSRSTFAEDKIDQLADLILESGGMYRPLILKQTGIERFDVLDGHLEYYAAVRAREKDPRRGEMVNAFVVSPKQEELIQQQLRLIDAPDTAAAPAPSDSPAAPDGGTLSSWITSFETRLSDLREEHFQTRRSLEARLDQFEKQAAERKTLLRELNSRNEQALITFLSTYGLNQTKAAAIYAARQQKESQQFDGFQDIVTRAKGVGPASILSLIDTWTRIHGPDA